jgi:hypothetical protein
MAGSKPPSPFTKYALLVLWYVGCVITLGYAPKYLRKIQGWQVYDPAKADKKYRAYTMDVNSAAVGLKTSVRAKQQVSYLDSVLFYGHTERIQHFRKSGIGLCYR